MPKVLLVSPNDVRPELASTVLARREIDWILARDTRAGFEEAISQQPAVVIVAVQEVGESEAFLRRPRQEKATRHMALVAMAPNARPPEEEALRTAGANDVLSGRPDGFRWNEALERLLHVPWRRETRIPVRMWVWFRVASDEEPIQGDALNLSLQGMLVETPRPVEVGTGLEMELKLPAGGRPLKLMGEIVRDAGSGEGKWLYGVLLKNLRAEDRELLAGFLESLPLQS